MLAVLLLATAAVTVAVMLLILPAGYRTDKFWLTFGFLLFAECLTFGYPMAITRRQEGKDKRADVPVRLTEEMVILFYDLGVGTLVIAAMTPLSFNHLLVFHLMLLLSLILASGSLFLGSMQVLGIAQELQEQRAPLIHFKQEFGRLRDRAHLIEHEGLMPAREVLESLDEDVSYSTTESLQGSQNVDHELVTCLHEMGDALSRIEKAVSDPVSQIKGPNDGPGQTGQPNLQESLRSFHAKAREMKQILARREEVIAQLR
ncbi:MAG: hypothetical protein HYU36_02710 [Planctomycetes bacterium]|nr:hypothetical protein [Planctomycetota bacterium]